MKNSRICTVLVGMVVTGMSQAGMAEDRVWSAPQLLSERGLGAGGGTAHALS